MRHFGAFIVLVTSWNQIGGAHSGHILPGCHQRLEFTCTNGLCIPRVSMCDGHTDCEDGSDEQLCSHVWCKKDEFACHSGRCISAHFLCNGTDECGDRSDENSCQNCTTGLYSCGPLDICLPRHKLCDGRADCKDGRDEAQELCGLTQPRRQKSPTCAASEFQCGDGKCIHMAWKCDHSPDCSDGSDEDNCDQNECEVNNGGCSHECRDQPMGFLCQCPENMRLVGDSQCEEVDPCLQIDVCDQLCVHTNGSFTCDCHEGYILNPTTRECNAKGHEAQLVFTSSTGMHWMRITGSKHRELASRLSGPGFVVALASNSNIYWAQQGQHSIYRFSLDGNPLAVKLVLNVKGPVSGLAVDWIHHLLYWTDVEKGSINVILLDGLTQHELITGLDKPSAVAVDAHQGFLFWSQCGNTPKIMRAGLDGQDMMTLVSSSILEPVALSLDMPRQLLYWVDQRMRSISRVTLQGRDRKTVVESNGYLDQPLGLAVFEGYVYWSDGVTSSICRANKHNGSQLQILLNNLTSPGGMVIVQPALQPDGSSVCGHPGQVCHHKCIVDLLSENLQFSCLIPKSGHNQPQGIPAISQTIPASSVSDPMFAGILSLIIFLSLLLMGLTLWWCREEIKPSRTLTVQQMFSLKESQDPLIVPRSPVHSNSYLVKETLLKLDFDSE